MAKILIVEDHAEFRDLLVRIVASTGNKVVAVANGEEAYADLMQETFDLVITDYNLGGAINGKAVAEIAGRTPVILMSLDEDNLKNPGENVRKTFLKPFKQRELAEAISKILQGRP